MFVCNNFKRGTHLIHYLENLNKHKNKYVDVMLTVTMATGSQIIKLAVFQYMYLILTPINGINFVV